MTDPASCPKTDAVLALHLDGDLDPTERSVHGYAFACDETLHAHLLHCDMCQGTLRRARRLDAALAIAAGADVAGHPASVRTTWTELTRNWLAVATGDAAPTPPPATVRTERNAERAAERNVERDVERDAECDAERDAECDAERDVECNAEGNVECDAELEPRVAPLGSQRVAPVASSRAPAGSSLAPTLSSLARDGSSLARDGSSLAREESSLARTASSLAPAGSWLAPTGSWLAPTESWFAPAGPWLVRAAAAVALLGFTFGPWLAASRERTAAAAAAVAAASPPDATAIRVGSDRERGPQPAPLAASLPGSARDESPNDTVAGTAARTTERTADHTAERSAERTAVRTAEATTGRTPSTSQHPAEHPGVRPGERPVERGERQGEPPAGLALAAPDTAPPLAVPPLASERAAEAPLASVPVRRAPRAAPAPAAAPGALATAIVRAHAGCAADASRPGPERVAAIRALLQQCRPAAAEPQRAWHALVDVLAGCGDHDASAVALHAAMLAAVRDSRHGQALLLAGLGALEAPSRSLDRADFALLTVATRLGTPDADRCVRRVVRRHPASGDVVATALRCGARPAGGAALLLDLWEDAARGSVHRATAPGMQWFCMQPAACHREIAEELRRSRAQLRRVHCLLALGRADDGDALAVLADRVAGLHRDEALAAAFALAHLPPALLQQLALPDSDHLWLLRAALARADLPLARPWADALALSPAERDLLHHGPFERFAEVASWFRERGPVDD